MSNDPPEANESTTASEVRTIDGEPTTVRGTETEAATEPKSEAEVEGESTLTAPTPTARRSLWTRLVGGFGVAVVGAGFWLAVGGWGLLAAAVIGLGWYRLSSLYAVAIGHAALLPFVTSIDTVTPAVLIAEVGFGLLLIAPAVDTAAPTAFVGAFLGSLGGLLVISVAVYRWSDRLWITAVVLLGALAVASYGLHRYELVRLGLVEEELS